MNKIKSKNKFKLKGFSLLEVLIMLLVVSFTMIAAMSIIAKANISIKNNEKLDVINDILFKSIELLKSPAGVYLTRDGYNNVNAGTNSYYFRLNETGGVGGFKYLEYNTGSNPQTIGTCNVSNFYFYPVIVNGVDQSYSICLQVRIQRTLNPITNKYYYIAATTVMYDLNDTVTTDSLITYRYENFETF